MKYIVYLTINLKSNINGLNRMYIGVHKTNKPNIFDGYLGCSININQPSTYMYPKTPLQCAVKKYGVTSFRRYTLVVCDTIEEAYRKLETILTNDVIDSSHIYNTQTEYKLCPLYQFDTNGELVKIWKYAVDAFDFYGYPKERFDDPTKKGCLFLNSYWSYSPNLKKSSDKYINETIYLYNKDGKLLKEFNKNELTDIDINFTIRNQILIKNNYYISNYVTDEFIAKPRRQCMNLVYYVYKSDGSFVGSYKGKEIMKVINLHSWKKINNIFTINNNWYKDFYISLKEVDKVPEKTKRLIDVCDKFGNFIESLPIKDIKTKYNITSAQLKNIQHGNKYLNDFIFRYNSK